MKRKPSDYNCFICHKDPGTTFMLKNSIWNKVTAGWKQRILCWDCCEMLLGRPIKADDLKPDAPCNVQYIKLLKQLEQAKHNKEISCET